MHDTRMVFCLVSPRPPPKCPLAQFVDPGALDRPNSVSGESISSFSFAYQRGSWRWSAGATVLCLRQHPPGAIKMEGPCGPWAHALARRPTIRYKPQAEPGLTAPSITILQAEDGSFRLTSLSTPNVHPHIR